MLAIRHIVVCGLALVLASSLSVSCASAEAAPLDPGVLNSMARVDERFQSYNVEMAEVIGGRFWKPYAHMSATNPPPAKIDVGHDPNLFEARSPVDLSNHRLRALAAALGPAYVRVSGTWANSVYFQNDDAPAVATAPEGYSGVLTRAEWRGVLDFAKAVDARLVTSVTVSSGVRDASGTWTPVQAQRLFDYTRSIGGEIFAAELFNEPNLASFGAGIKGYDAAAFARDSGVFRAFVAQAAPDLKIVGPGDVATANAPIPGAPTAEALLTATPQPRFDILSYHFYPGVSQRCAPPDDASVGTNRDQALTDAWLARTDRAFEAHKAVRDQYAPKAPIWITETAQAACGGSPWAATFIDTFRYLDQMGRLAKQGVSAIFHNTLAASEYGLIESTAFEPRPNYWAALLWRRLMGTVVLDAGPIVPGLHVYAQCLRDRSGGVSVLAINTGKAASLKVVGSPAEVYALSSPSLASGAVLLNGQPLAIGADDRVPELHPQRMNGMRLMLAPQSIDFIALPRARNPNCK
jgi:heparanase 1